MTSRMAMDDIERLRADGIDVPPREVVRLNALGLRVERGTDSPALYAAPRFARVGDALLWETTLGARMWLRQAEDTFNLDDDVTAFSMQVLTSLVPWRELPPPTDASAVRKAIRAAMKKLGDATVRQVRNALDWCNGGNAPESGEEPSPKPSAKGKDDESAAAIPARYSPEFGLFYRGVAVGLGTAEDIKDMPLSAMLAACDRAEEIACMSAFGGGAAGKTEEQTALGDYLRTLDAIREAGEKRPAAAAHDPRQASKYVPSARMPSAAARETSSSSAISHVGRPSSGSDPSVPSRPLPGGPHTASIGDISEKESSTCPEE